MTPEGRIKRALSAYLKSIGAWYYMPVPMGYGGHSLDYFVCHQGRFYGIETKRPGVEEATKRQQCCMREIARAGGGVWIENSEGLETTREKLK